MDMSEPPTFIDGYTGPSIDTDPTETSEWLDALDSVVATDGQGRAQYLVARLIQEAARNRIAVPGAVSTPYINTIRPEDEAPFPGDAQLEKRIRRFIRWNAAVMVIRANRAAPGIGGHLPGEKVSQEVSQTRMIPVGSDALSPAPHHDIYSIEDLRQLIYALKEATNYEKPVSVKIAAVHNIAAIASGIVRAGADIVYLDGFRGGTGAAPTIIRDHLGIPIEIAIAVVDQQLRDEGIRNQASLIAAGGIRSSADAAKAIALGADAVALGTGALLALGCTLCQKCYTGRCSWGITTQDPALTRRLDPHVGAQRLTNLVQAWSAELEEILGAMGVNAVESLRGSRERLRAVGLDQTTLDILRVKPAGVGA